MTWEESRARLEESVKEWVPNDNSPWVRAEVGDIRAALAKVDELEADKQRLLDAGLLYATTINRQTDELAEQAKRIAELENQLALDTPEGGPTRERLKKMYERGLNDQQPVIAAQLDALKVRDARIATLESQLKLADELAEHADLNVPSNAEEFDDALDVYQEARNADAKKSTE